MEDISIQLTVHGRRILDPSARATLSNEEVFKPLPLRRAEQVWRGPIPNQICFMAQVQESAVFITEDWEVSIYSRRLLDCAGAMGTIVNALVQVFGTPVEIMLLDANFRCSWQSWKCAIPAIGPGTRHTASESAGIMDSYPRSWRACGCVAAMVVWGRFLSYVQGFRVFGC
jgi:hypothetical protein